ncbi:MAG: ABZJ_00895 family protein [Roseobacter sp.]
MWNPRRFTINIILFSFGIWLATGILEVLFNWNSPQVASSFVPAMFAAMQEGQRYGLVTGHRPEKATIWSLSRAMAEIHLTLMVILSIFASILSPDVRYMFAHINLALLFIVFGLFTGLSLVFMRWGYSLGIKLGLQEREKNTG